jgi:hypothetical protein
MGARLGEPHGRRHGDHGGGPGRSCRHAEGSDGRGLLEAKKDGHANPLVKAVADDFSSPETQAARRDRIQSQFAGAKPGELKQKAMDELRGTVALVNEKAAYDAEAFKGWLSQVAQKTEEAAKEGGFLGFGGVAVSDAERATLAEIAGVLGHPAPGQT